MSYAEIMEFIDGRAQKEKEELQTRAAMDHALACLLSIAFNNPKKMPKTVEKAYPGLFKQHVQSEQDWRIIKANMSAIAQAHNARWEVKCRN